MTPTPDQPGFASRAADPMVDELRRLRADLERMTTYAHALEHRCNRLWTYVPDTHGTHDPVLPFVARHCDLILEPASDAS